MIVECNFRMKVKVISYFFPQFSMFLFSTLYIIDFNLEENPRKQENKNNTRKMRKQKKRCMYTRLPLLVFPVDPIT